MGERVGEEVVLLEKVVNAINDKINHNKITFNATNKPPHFVRQLQYEGSMQY